MPRTTVLQTNFTAGEISPKLYGRVDIAKYQNGAKEMRDTLPQIYGGARRRPGSIFVREVKDSADETRLIPFVKDATTAYVLEFGDLYMRVYKNGAVVESSPGVPYEVVSPYTSAQAMAMDYTQGADTMFLFHQAVAPYKLVCTSDTSWSLAAATFINTPFEEPGSYPAATLTPSAASPVGGACNFTAGSSVFVAGDVGSSVKINGGIVKITGYSSGTAVSGVIKQVLSSTTAAPQDAWSLHAPAWSASRGYPRTGTLFEQRLIAGGSPTFPQTIWGSVTGAYLDFQQGTEDDDGFAFTIASDITNPIRYLASSRALLALTSGVEFTVTGGLEKPLAPTNAQIKARSNYGCADVRPVRIREQELFVQRAGRKLRAFGYNVTNDDWTAPDVSVLAEHLTEGGIVDMCWQQEPESVVWFARDDGVLGSVTYDKDQDVAAWALHDGFAGAVESMCSIPTADADQVWLVVRRTINGGTKRYIERLSDTVLCDSAVVSTGASATVWSGFSHLEGEDVAVVAGGSYAGLFTVASGQITLDRAATSIVGGLPFENRVSLLPPEIQTGMGSATGNAMRTGEVTLRFYETSGALVNGDEVQFSALGASLLDQPAAVFSGVKRMELLGWERGESEVEISQPYPMPFHLLSVTRRFTSNDG